jgi:uncharacterized cupredoxin-like copper-binding protein
MKKALSLWILLGTTIISACGQSSAADNHIDGAEQTAPRQVTILMTEYSFTTSDSVFTAGVPYLFTFENEGHEAHEWAVVPRGAEDESNLLFEVEEEDLAAGATITREFTFPEPGEYDFACFLPGHYENGMVLPVRVE